MRVRRLTDQSLHLRPQENEPALTALIPRQRACRRVKIVDDQTSVPDGYMATRCGFVPNPTVWKAKCRARLLRFGNGTIFLSHFHDRDMVRSDNYPMVVTHIAPPVFEVHAPEVDQPGMPRTGGLVPSFVQCGLRVRAPYRG